MMGGRAMRCRLSPRGLGALLAAALVLLVTACTATPETPVTERLAQHLGLLDELGVDVYWNDSDCEYIAYGRGVFNRDPSSPLCRVLGFGSGRLMDEQAAADIRSIVDAFEASGLRPTHISREVGIGTNGPSTKFALDACSVYDYAPLGRKAQEEGALETIVPLEGGWFLITPCFSDAGE